MTTGITIPPHLKEVPFLENIYRDVHEKDLSCIIVVDGKLGKGKSCTANYISFMLDVGESKTSPSGWVSRFNLSRCHFNTVPFVEDITKRTPEKRAFYPKGTCFILDETNVESGSNEWFTLRAKALAKALQTNRKYNYIMIFTAPEAESIAKSIRRRIDIEITHLRKIEACKETGKPAALCKVKYSDFKEKGDLLGKFHRAFIPIPIEIDNEGRTVNVYRKVRISQIYIPKIPADIEAAYNELKDEALSDWYEKEMDGLKALVKSEKKDQANNDVDKAREIILSVADKSIFFNKKAIIDVHLMDFLKAKGVVLPVRQLSMVKSWLKAEYSHEQP